MPSGRQSHEADFKLCLETLISVAEAADFLDGGCLHCKLQKKKSVPLAKPNN